MTAFDGQTITYDAIGNPTSYYNGTRWAFTWGNGRRLLTANNGTNALAFAYDVDGMRTEKTVDGVTHRYLYAGGKLMRESYGSNTLDFVYDANGTPYALKYNGTTYYYITNLQGDVMQLIDASGNTVASYDYDPYGKVISSTGAMAEINPIRYRGYYYDNETGFYYLQSRYYDPAICRFILPDTFASTGQRIIGYNMYSYCNNNPVTEKDFAGAFAITAAMVSTAAAVGAISAVIGAIANTIPVATSGGSTQDCIRAAAAGAAGGFVGGAVGTILAELGFMAVADIAGRAAATLVTDSISALGDKSTSIWEDIGWIAVDIIMDCTMSCLVYHYSPIKVQNIDTSKYLPSIKMVGGTVFNGFFDGGFDVIQAEIKIDNNRSTMSSIAGNTKWEYAARKEGIILGIIPD